MNPVEIIQLKKRNQALSRPQLQSFITAYLNGDIEDYQMSALLMAIWFRGLSDEETTFLTEIMRDSGERIQFPNKNFQYIDKHSTGGVGDKTSLILAPLVAAAGVRVPMMAGRGLAHTGGTLDKLEAIPGFRVGLSVQEFKSHIENSGFAIMGQTQEICPADRRIYALRDVTATVDSLPLICASIMSKKLAEGINGLVLDVKYGSGAFMKSAGDAEELAKRLKAIGEKSDVRVRALITSMEEPLGRYVGNALEVLECVEIMEGKTKPGLAGEDLYHPTRELTLQLAAEMLVLGGKAKTSQEGYTLARDLLVSGQALKEFHKMCAFQGPADINLLPKASFRKALTSPQKGFITKMHTELIGQASVELGAGRLRTADKIDPAVGFEFNVRLGDAVNTGDPLAWIHSNDNARAEAAAHLLQKSIVVGPNKIETPPLILKRLE